MLHGNEEFSLRLSGVYHIYIQKDLRLKFKKIRRKVYALQKT